MNPKALLTRLFSNGGIESSSEHSSKSHQTMSGYIYLREFLQNEGFQFKEENEVIKFKFEGKNYIAFKNENNPFLQITLIYGVENIPRNQLLETCNSMNQQHFVSKFTIDEDSDVVWCSFEFKPNKNTDSKDFLEILSILRLNAHEFFEEIGQ